MFSILREFYLGNLSPSERLKPEHLNYMATLKQANDYEEILLSKLSEADKKLYKEMASHRAASYSEEVVQAFVDGYSLGALFLLEIMERKQRYGES